MEERRLIIAVLLQAIHDCVATPPQKHLEKMFEKHKKDAFRWLNLDGQKRDLDHDVSTPFSFSWICFWLEFDEKRMKARIKKIVNEITPSQIRGEKRFRDFLEGLSNGKDSLEALFREVGEGKKDSGEAEKERDRGVYFSGTD